MGESMRLGRKGAGCWVSSAPNIRPLDMGVCYSTMRIDMGAGAVLGSLLLLS